MLEKNMVSNNAGETQKIALNLAKKFKGGEVVALVGDLGAGKTTFVKGIARGLGIKQNITSPTFVLMKEYKDVRRKTLDVSLIHMDCYRLESAEDALSLGITDYLGKKDTIVLIEWPEKITKILPENTIKIIFKHISDNKRSIKVSAKS